MNKTEYWGKDGNRTESLPDHPLLDNMSDTTYHEIEDCTYEIEFYETEDGKCPVCEFLDSLDPKMKAKVLRTIDLLEANGPVLRKPYSEAIGDGLFELRTKLGSNITRIFYFFFIGQKAVLTNGFVKKSQKTPKTELDLAKKYKEDYERRYDNEQL